MLFPSPKNEEALYPGWYRHFPQPCGVVYTALQCSGWFFPVLGDFITDALIIGWDVFTHKGLHVSRLFHVLFLPFTYSVFPGPVALFSSTLFSSAQCNCPALATPPSLFLGCLKQSSCDPGDLPCLCPSLRLTVLHCLLSIVWKL